LSGRPFSTPIQGRIAVWKAIGALLGMFNYTDAALVASAQKWLQLADDFIGERVIASNVVREACRRLSSHDWLSANDAVTLSDFILDALVTNTTYLPNNVELWSKRLETI
jgi:hypothetical protein